MIISKSAKTSELCLDLGGISYHYSRISYYDFENREWKKYNEVNPGFGIQWTIRENKKHIFWAKAGIYKDSKSNITKYIGPGYQYKLLEYLHAGIGVVYLKSDTYNFSIAPLPLLTFRYKFLRLSGMWMPTFGDTESGAVAFFLTLTFWKKK